MSALTARLRLTPTGRLWLGLTALLAFCGGCVSVAQPLLHASVTRQIADTLALAPHKTCEELKSQFGVEHLTVVNDPGELGLTYEEVFVESDNGAALRVWLMPAEGEQRGVLLYAMGAVGDMSCYLLTPYMLTQFGWTVVIFDFQGFGGSGGAPTLSSLYPDIDAVLTWTLARTDAQRVTLMGVSLGTMPTAALAANRPDHVAAIVIDGPINLRTELVHFGGAFFEVGLDGYVHQFDPVLLLDLQLQQSSAPTLLFTYELDEYGTSAVIADIVAGRDFVDQHHFVDLAHARGPYQRPAEYFLALETFLAQTME